MADKSHTLQMRVEPDWLTVLDNWRRHEPDIPARAEAIRRLVDRAIKGGVPAPVAAPTPAAAPQASGITLDIPDEILRIIPKYRRSRPYIDSDEDALLEWLREGVRQIEPPEEQVEIEAELMTDVHRFAGGTAIPAAVNRLVRRALDDWKTSLAIAEDEASDPE